MKPQLPTRVPQVVDGLLAILAEREALENVQVIDGPALSLDQVEYDSIAIAPGTPDLPGVMVTYTEQTGLGRTSYVEQVEVSVTLASYAGDTDMKARRDRVTALLAELQAALTANQVRENAWDAVAMGPEAVWHPVQSPQGATCAVGVTVVARSVI